MLFKLLPYLKLITENYNKNMPYLQKRSTFSVYRFSMQMNEPVWMQFLCVV